MSAIFSMAGAILVLLEITPVITKKAEGILPLGGSHTSQLAVVFGLAFVIHEFMVVMH